jgi:hypothetical protein
MSSTILIPPRAQVCIMCAVVNNKVINPVLVLQDVCHEIRLWTVSTTSRDRVETCVPVDSDSGVDQSRFGKTVCEWGEPCVSLFYVIHTGLTGSEGAHLGNDCLRSALVVVYYCIEILVPPKQAYRVRTGAKYAVL